MCDIRGVVLCKEDVLVLLVGMCPVVACRALHPFTAGSHGELAFKFTLLFSCRCSFLSFHSFPFSCFLFSSFSSFLGKEWVIDE